MNYNNKWIKKFKDGYTIKGKEIGPKSIILAGVHGNEICGVKAFMEIVPNLNLNKGEVTFVFGNPEAIKKNIRLTEFNLNRAFRKGNFYSTKIKKTYEYKRAQYLKKLFNQSEALLDLHSTTNPGSKPFIICDQKARKITESFSKKFVREVIGFDEIEPGATEDYMINKGKIGITLECGQHLDPKSIEIAKGAILDFLTIRGHIHNRKITKTKRPAYKVEKLYKNTAETFTLRKQFIDFSTIKKGEIIGKDGDIVIKSDRSGVMVFAHNCKIANQEAFILGKKI